MPSLALAGPSRPVRALNAGRHSHGSNRRRTHRTSVPRQARSHSRRELCDRLPATRFRRAYVNAPVLRASQHPRHRQALLRPTVHRSTTPKLSYGPASSADPPPRAAVVSAPPSLAMSAAVMTMAYTPSAQASTPVASTPPLVIRRGRSATPLFLQRTPTFQPHPRSSASMSQLAQPRPNASLPQLASTCLPPSTFNRASAPLTGSRSASESARTRIAGRSLSSEAHLPKLRATTDRSPPPSAFSKPSASTCIQLPPTGGCAHPSRASPSPSTSVSPSPSPLPSLLPSPVLVDKDLPPIPSPSEPPTPSEEDALDPEFRFPLPRPSRIPSLRPLSFDAEATIRELEELAASIMVQDPAREAEKLAASFNAYGLPVIETDLWHDDQMPAAIAEESSPITPRPPKFTQDDVPFAAKPVNAVQSDANLSVPHIVVTDPSKKQQTPSIPSPVSPAEKAKGEQGDDAEELQWVYDYGAWGTSEKGKWKASAGEAEEESNSDHDLSPRSKSTPLPRASSENTYIYEPVGAPEFLVGSSTSPVVRATTGYRSCRRPSKHFAPEALRVRRRRPAPLTLANPAQAEVDLEATLAAALFLGPPKPPRRPQTAPNTARARQPTPPSTWLPLKRSLPSNVFRDAPPPSGVADHSAHPNISSEGEGNRRSDPIPAIPHSLFPSAMFSSHDLRPLRLQEGERTSQGVPWPSFPAGSGGNGTSSSEPNTPRPHARPRLKSLKGLFKHWSK